MEPLSIHPGFYTTLEERRNGEYIPNEVYILHKDTEILLNSLFIKENMIISLPKWISETSNSSPSVYTIRYSRNNRNQNLTYLFAGDYDPLVIRNYLNDIVGIIFEKYYFSRNR